MKKTPSNKDTNFTDMSRVSYEYPNGINLHPDSENHRKLLNLVLDAAGESYDVIQQRFSAWREIDQKMTVYIDLDTEEQKIKDSDESRPVSMVVPVMYATRETLLSYQVAAFLQQPTFRYIPSRDPKDTLGVLLLENVVEQDCIRSKAGLELYSSWSDAFTYGFGGCATSYTKKTGLRTKRIDNSFELFGIKLFGGPTTQRVRETLFEGSEIFSLDPYNTLPDPAVPVTQVQNGNYFGWVERTNYNDLLSEERDSEGAVFNVKYIEKSQLNCASSYYSANDVNSGRYDKTGVNTDPLPTGSSKRIDKLVMFIKLIPAEYGLGDGEYPEIWKVVVVADRLIVEASELGADHNQLPVGMSSPESDMHTTLPVSILEREYPLQHAIDWLWKSHVANVRKAVNNMFVVDPQRINMDDLLNTKFGMVARLRPSAWGMGVKDAIEQLSVSDITRNNISDIGFLMGIDNSVFASPQAKGVFEHRGERVSAQEARDTRTSLMSKFEKTARLMAMQGHYDIAYQLASNTIQFMTEDKYIKLTGDYLQELAEEYGVAGNFVKVSPKALDVRFDVVPQDGSIPGGEYADVWERLLNNAAMHPEVYQGLDFVRAWKHVARLLGARNVRDFMKKPVQTSVMEEDKIEESVRKGDLVPVQQQQIPQGVV